MSHLKSLMEEVKRLVRTLLISSPHLSTVNTLCKDFLAMDGRPLPFKALGYNTPLDLLLAMPDVVVVEFKSGGNSPSLRVIPSEKSQHISKLVQKQKTSKSPRSFNPPQRQKYFKADSQTCKSLPLIPKRVMRHPFVPAVIQNALLQYLHNHPQGITQWQADAVISKYPLEKYDVKNVTDVVASAPSLFYISNGKVFAIGNSKPLVSHDKAFGNTSILSSGIQKNTSLSLGTQYSHVQDGGISSNTVPEPIVNGSELNGPQDCDSRPMMFNSNKFGELDKASFEDSSKGQNCSHISDLVIKNLRKLLDFNPTGIWCSTLAYKYKESFGVFLNTNELGYTCMIQMASHIPHIFHVLRPCKSDWLLLDARKPIPEQYDTYNIKNPKYNQAPEFQQNPLNKISRNLVWLLENYPAGLTLDRLAACYQNSFLGEMNYKELGFETMEKLLIALVKEGACNLHYETTGLLVLPGTLEQVLSSTLHFVPEIVEDPKEEFMQSLYPEDVLGPNQNVPQVELPAHVVSGLTLEVLVSEILSPHQFWVIMRGDKYNIALDKMMTNLQGHYILHHTLYKMPLMAVQVNQDCCCKHGDEWHRARITEILSLFEVMVTFYDYGTQTKIRIDDLRFLCSKFSKLPAQAIESSLANVEPRDRSNVWSRSASYWLLGKVYNNKPLVAIICNIHEQKRHLSLSLVDTTGEDDIHINDLLVKEGYARFISEEEDTIPAQQQIKRGQSKAVPVVHKAATSVHQSPPGFKAPLVTADISLRGESPVTNLNPLTIRGHSKAVPGVHKAATSVHQSPPGFKAALVAADISLRVESPLNNLNPLTSRSAPCKVDTLTDSSNNSSPLSPISTSDEEPSIDTSVPPTANFTDTPLTCTNTYLDVFTHNYSQLLNVFALQQQMHQQYVESLMLGVAVMNTSLPQPALTTYTQLVQHNPLISPLRNPQTASVAQIPVSSPQNSNTSCPITVNTSPVITELPSYYSLQDLHPIRNPHATFSESVINEPVYPSPPILHKDIQESFNNYFPETETLMALPTYTDQAAAISRPLYCKNGVDVMPTRDWEEVDSFPYPGKQEDNCSSWNTQQLVIDDMHQKTQREYKFDHKMISLDSNKLPPFIEDVEGEIFRSNEEEGGGYSNNTDDEDEEEQFQHGFVRTIFVAGRPIQLLNIDQVAYMCTDEFVHIFTHFSSRHTVLKIVFGKGIEFKEIRRSGYEDLFTELDYCNAEYLNRSRLGYILSPLHLIPFAAVPQVLKILELKNSPVLKEFHDKIAKFNPRDDHWDYWVGRTPKR